MRNPKSAITGTVEETYRLFQKGLSLEQIAAQRSLAPSTIASHIEKLIQAGSDIDIDRLIAPVKRREIEEMFLKSQHLGLKSVVEQANGVVSYEEARIARKWMQRRED
ncbi:MAG: helix-turn-helix domain-containing protein [Deltaproteobacteria bacterium]|nr:helix-turn-helix domain-containing protein [Deltaproteobacteria bacterium]